MDQRKCEENDQNVLEFNSTKTLDAIEKSIILSPMSGEKPSLIGNQNLELKFALQTPEKRNEPLHTKIKEEEPMHLEKYKTILSFFDAMTCSWRLLSLCKKNKTFRNISKQVEILTKRKFTCRHLAQMKYILPEAIQIDEFLAHNKKTLCMESDVKISLLFDIVEGHSQDSDFVALRQLFASRVISFSSKQPGACDIPEATLPKAFRERVQTTLGTESTDLKEALGSGHGRNQTIDLEPATVDSLEPLSIPAVSEMPSTFHLHPSFSRHFSQKIVAEDTDEVKNLRSTKSVSCGTSDGPNEEVVRTSQLEESLGDNVTNKDIESEQQKELNDSRTILSPSPQLLSTKCLVDSSSNESPQQKHALSADNPMIETPAQLIPKRSVPSCDEKLKTTTTQDHKSYCKPAKRSLDFSHLEGDGSALDDATVSTDNNNAIYDDVPQALQTKGLPENEDAIGSASGKVKGRHHNLKEDCKMIQQTNDGLADLVTLIHRIFQCVNCSSITKQELVHKIIMNNLDIVERKEAEEQIELLEKLVPDWIYKNLGPSGDVMYNIKKVPDLASIKARVIST